MHTLKLLWTPLSVLFAIAIVAASIVLGYLAWRRSSYARSTGWMELLRICLVLMVAMTLIQPEYLEEYRPQERPTLVVLCDASGSMETADVFGPKGDASTALTRSESISPFISPSWWTRLSDRMEVIVEPFSSSLPDKHAGTDLHGALNRVLDSYDNLRGVVLLSDGDWNLGEAPAGAAARLRAQQIPVYAVTVGSRSRLPDLEISQMDVPTFAVLNKTLRIPFTIESSLPRDQVTQVMLTPSSGEPITKNITIPAMGNCVDTLEWKPSEAGEFELTLSIPQQAEETITQNNQRTVPIEIRKETIKVLLIEAFPRWEYRYLRNALNRDPGVEVSCLLFHPGLGKAGGGFGYLATFPESPEELAKYDVIFLGDVSVNGGELTPDQCSLIKGLVQSQASGLILMPGFRGGHFSFVGTELDSLYPVVLDPAQRRGWGSRIPAQFELTEAGQRSLLTKLDDSEEENVRIWESLPGFQWYAPVERAKAGSEVLAVHSTESSPSGRIPLLVTKTSGTGKVLFMGTDGAWRWREGVEDKYHYRFWGQVARWMAYQRNMAKGESMRLFYSPDRPQQGATVTLHANVMTPSGEPLQKGIVSLQIKAPSGKVESIRLLSEEDEWGLFAGNFIPQEAGEYKLLLQSQETNAILETKVAVQGIQREKIGKPARSDVLQEIANLTGGKMVDTRDIQGLLDTIAKLPEPEPLVRRLRLWCHPLWIGTLIGLLGLFWTLRKIMGTV